ncbi:MAG: YicC family protein [candidate division Zixibacteria bacterium]|nr:YicC family protein [candidate division Zixibacteria bacterium]
MIYSMTGFGKGTAEESGLSVEVEINSLNSRFLDAKFKLPGYLSAIEYRLRQLVAGKINRGKLSIFVSVNSTTADFKPMKIDIASVEKFYNEVVLLKSKLGLSGEIDINVLLNMPDAIVSSYDESELEIAYAVIAGALEQALDELNVSRNREGEVLAADIRQRLQHIKTECSDVEKLAPENSAYQLKKLKDRLKTILGDTEIDESRLIMEAGILAERYDITEELVRLQSHLANFESDLKTGGDLGKRLSFILQEMGREINTIGSKCGNAEISSHVVNIKEELEKIREQLANLE